AMIQRVKIRNYKSVQALDLDCKRYNVFLGDTSTGKSNILEALTLLSQGVIVHDKALGAHAFDKRVVRYDRLSDLFTNADLNLSINVEADEALATLGSSKKGLSSAEAAKRLEEHGPNTIP